MLMEISCSAIHVPAPERFVYSQADWPAYTAAVSNATVDLQLDGQPVQAVEDAVNQWYDNLLTAKTTHIPRSSSRPLPHPRDSHQLQVLKAALKATWEEGEQQGWTPLLYQHHKRLQRELIV